MHHDTSITPRTDRVAVVVNTASRTGARALPLVSAALRRTAEEVVGGGDGTIGCAAGPVAHTGTTLGVLALGTANDFGRTLEIRPH